MNGFLIAVGLASVMGCTHHRSVKTLDGFAGEVVAIETVHGPGVVEAEVVRASDARLVLRTFEYGDLEVSDIKTVRETFHSLGAIEGLAIGVAIGAPLGFLIGSRGDDGCDDCGYNQTARLAAVGLGGLGGVIGLLGGLIIGARFVYEPSAPPRLQASGPPGSAVGLTCRF